MLFLFSTVGVDDAPTLIRSAAGVTDYEVAVGIASALWVACGVRFLALHGVFQLDPLRQPLEPLRIGLRLSDGVLLAIVCVHPRSIHPTSRCCVRQNAAQFWATLVHAAAGAWHDRVDLGGAPRQH